MHWLWVLLLQLAIEVKMQFVGVNYAPDSSGEEAVELGAGRLGGRGWVRAKPPLNRGPEFWVLRGVSESLITLTALEKTE